MSDKTKASKAFFGILPERTPNPFNDFVAEEAAIIAIRKHKDAPFRRFLKRHKEAMEVLAGVHSVSLGQRSIGVHSGAAIEALGARDLAAGALPVDGFIQFTLDDAADQYPMNEVIVVTCPSCNTNIKIITEV